MDNVEKESEKALSKLVVITRGKEEKKTGKRDSIQTCDVVNLNKSIPKDNERLLTYPQVGAFPYIVS